jgi:hypothetical protein
METNLSSFLMIIGLGVTLIGALFGVKGVWGENSDTYYGRAFFYFFNLEYYISMINQKYRSLIGFLLIGVGTAMQISVNFINYTFYIFNHWILYFVALTILTIFFFVIEIIIKWKVRNIVIRKVLRNYYNEYTKADLNENNRKERLENIYTVIYLGKNKKFEEIDEGILLQKATKILNKLGI